MFRSREGEEDDVGSSVWLTAHAVDVLAEAILHQTGTPGPIVH